MYELSGSVRDAYGELLRHQELLVGLGARFGEGCGESSLGRFAHRDGLRRGLRGSSPRFGLALQRRQIACRPNQKEPSGQVPRVRPQRKARVRRDSSVCAWGVVRDREGLEVLVAPASHSSPAAPPQGAVDPPQANLRGDRLLTRGGGRWHACGSSRLPAP